MDSPANLGYIRAELDDELGRRRGEFPEPLPTEKFIASSALQKSIRRGDKLTAARAAATLNLLDRRMLWRRLMVIAHEDVGVGDVIAVTQATAAAERADWRARHGDAKIALLVVDKLTGAAKCRATDLLYAAARHHPDLAEDAERLAEVATGALLDLVVDTDRPPALRALAAIYVAGTSGEKDSNICRREGCSAIWWRYQEMGVAQSLLDACQVAFRRLRIPLPVILPLVLSLVEEPTSIEDSPIPEPRAVNGIPLYALDTHTRLGRAAIREWRQSSDKLTQYSEGAVRVAAFYTDADPTRPRYRWPMSDALRDLGVAGNLAREGVTGGAVHDLLSACGNELPTLDDIRARLLAEAPSPFPLDLFAKGGR